MLKKKNNVKLFFNFYLFLLIFNILNRECNIIIDFRYIIILISILLIIYYYFNKRKIEVVDDKRINNYSRLIKLFYFLIIISNINLLFNNIKLNESIYNNLIILNLYNFINLYVLKLYYFYIDKDKVMKFIKISFLVLGLSMIYSFVFHEIPFSDANTGISLGKDQYNLLGNNYRLGGFLLDANYVTIISMSFIILELKFDAKFISKIFYISLSLIYILFSFSKTIFLMLPFILMFNYIISIISDKKTKKLLLSLVLLIILFIPMILLSTNLMGSMTTMKLRYDMWRTGIELFLKNPLLGNGLSSFRSYMSEVNNWYVQCHCTIIQILCEHGILTLLVFYLIYFKLLNINDKKLRLILLVFLSLELSYETLYLNFIIFYFGLIPALFLKESETDDVK